jgi:hypothetical protein
MNIIYKYLVKWDRVSKTTAEVCIDSRIIDFGFQGNELYLWAIVDTAYTETKEIELEIYGTCWEIDKPNELKHLKTLQQDSCVWHIFVRNK